MRVTPGNAQHIGDRESQQDAFAFGSFDDRAFERHGGVMMVLCDGMGGLAHGAAASRAAIDAVMRGYYRKQPSEDIASALDRSIREANQAVCAISGEGGAAGTTIVVAVVWQDRVQWASLGDSRLYLCRGDAPAVQLTEDHNVASMFDRRIARGESYEHETASIADREALTAYLGAPQLPPLTIGRDSQPLRPGDRIVACSDGLYRGLSPEAIAAIARHPDPMVAAEQMIEAVREQRLPYQDNLTVVLFKVSAERRLIDRIKLPGAATRAALAWAGCGFGTAIVLVAGLISLGVLNFSSGSQRDQPVAAVQAPDPKASPDNPLIPTPMPAQKVTPEHPLSPTPAPLQKPLDPQAELSQPPDTTQQPDGPGSAPSANLNQGLHGAGPPPEKPASLTRPKTENQTSPRAARRPDTTER